MIHIAFFRVLKMPLACLFKSSCKFFKLQPAAALEKVFNWSHRIIEEKKKRPNRQNCQETQSGMSNPVQMGLIV